MASWQVPYHTPMGGAPRAVVLCLLVLVAVGSGAEQLPPFPNFTFQGLDGASSVTVEGLRGRPLLLTFWASWCGPCRVELPELQKLHEELGGRGLALVTVNIDSSPAAARQFVERHGLKIPVYRMAQRDLARLGVVSIPTTILLDPDGRPVQLYEGYSPGETAVLRQLVLAMLEQRR